MIWAKTKKQAIVFVVTIAAAAVFGYVIPTEAKQLITTSDIQDSAVTTAKIADNAVSNAKILNGAVETDKLGNGAVTSQKIASGAVSLAVIQRTNLTSVAPLSNGLVVANCLDGETLTGGGFLTGGFGGDLIVTASIKNPTSNGWAVTAISTHPTDTNGLEAYAYCATVTP